jgi:formylglycine-generating enzyme required for sulfatase activity
MGDFGQFELVEQLDLAGYVWSARKGADSPPIYAVRFRDAPGKILLAAAEVQKQMSDAKAGGWAPIHDIGRTPKGGAYYVTDAYPWSAQLLFEQKDRVTSLHLLKLCDDLAAALERISAQLSRGHGNLRLSNVLLTSRNLSEATIAISDPAPNAPADQTADRRDLGRLIFELVTGQQFKDFFWPVVTQEKWDALGPDGPKWLDWCNRLLAPGDNPTACTLAQFRTELDSIRPDPTFGERMAALPWKRISAVAAVLVIVLVGAGIGYRLYERAQLNKAIAANHQAIDQDFQQFVTFTAGIEQTFAAVPELKKKIEQADIVEKARKDADIDLSGVERIDDLPPLRQKAIEQIETEHDLWRKGAMEALDEQRFGIDRIDVKMHDEVHPLKTADDQAAAFTQAVQLVSAMARLAAVWPQGGDTDRTNALGDLAVNGIISNPGAVDLIVQRFQNMYNSRNTPGVQAYLDADHEIEASKKQFRELAGEITAQAPADRPKLYADLLVRVQEPAFPDLEPTPEGVAKWKQDALRQINDTRARAVGKALANAKAVTFGQIKIINDEFAVYTADLGRLDPETALRQAAVAIRAMERLRDAWPKVAALPLNAMLPVGDRQDIASAYQQHLTDVETAAVQSALAQPREVPAAIAALRDQESSIHSIAMVVAEEFLSVVKAQALLADRTSPPVASAWKKQWDDLKSALTTALQPPEGWPNPEAAQPLGQVNTVLSALQSDDVRQLQDFSATGGPPALLTAVCLRWPAVIDSPDPNVDYAIYQNISKGLGQLPQDCADVLAGKWSSRLKAAADPPQADSLWGLAEKMNLQRVDAAVGGNYFNDLLGYLKTDFPPYKPGDKDKKADAVRKAVIGVFLSKTTGFEQWGFTSSELSEVSDFRDHLTFNPRPGTGPLPSKDFQRLPDGDVVYTPPFNPALQMRFKLMIFKTGGSYYLCTTEVPVDWFLGLTQDKADIFKHLMDRFVPQFLVGPCIWREDGDWISLNNATAWLPPGAFTPWSAQCNPVDLESPVKPMNYVSPLAAMDAARLIGCRLPTVTEWLYAYNSDQRDNDDNTNGPNWQTLRRAIASIPAPHDSSTRFLGHFQTEVPLDSVSAQPASVNDVLWFRDVPQNYAKFHDMRGNIQNWVMDVPAGAAALRLINDDPITLVDAAGTHTLASQNDAQLADFYEHCMRLGLSSTSPPSQDPTKPTVPPDQKDRHHHQFFDVGFRLALDDTPPDPMQYIADSIRDRKPLGS